MAKRVYRAEVREDKDQLIRQKALLLHHLGGEVLAHLKLREDLFTCLICG